MDPERDGGTPGVVDAKLPNKWTQVGEPRRTEKRFEEFVREELKEKHVHIGLFRSRMGSDGIVDEWVIVKCKQH